MLKIGRPNSRLTLSHKKRNVFLHNLGTCIIQLGQPYSRPKFWRAKTFASKGLPLPYKKFRRGNPLLQPLRFLSYFMPVPYSNINSNMHFAIHYFLLTNTIALIY